MRLLRAGHKRKGWCPPVREEIAPLDPCEARRPQLVCPGSGGTFGDGARASDAGKLAKEDGHQEALDDGVVVGILQDAGLVDTFEVGDALAGQQMRAGSTCSRRAWGGGEGGEKVPMQT